MYQASSARNYISGTIDPKNFQRFNVNVLNKSNVCNTEHVECKFKCKNNVKPHFDKQQIARQNSSQNLSNLMIYFMRGGGGSHGKTMSEHKL